MPSATQAVPHEPWYKYGVAFLVLEMAIAITISSERNATPYLNQGSWAPLWAAWAVVLMT